MKRSILLAQCVLVVACSLGIAQDANVCFPTQPPADLGIAQNANVFFPTQPPAEYGYNHGMYVWIKTDMYPWDNPVPIMAGRNDLINACQSNPNLEINTIFYSVYHGDGSNRMYALSALRDFNKFAHARRLRVEALYSDNSEDPDNGMTRVDNYVAYQNFGCNEDSQKFDAFHLDYEPDTNKNPFASNIPEERDRRAVALLDYYMDVRDKLDDLDIGGVLVIDIAHYWDHDQLEEITYNTGQGRLKKKLSEHVIDIADEVCVMAYQDNVAHIIERACSEVSYGAARGVPVYVSVETRPSDSPAITFDEEGEAEMLLRLGSVMGWFETENMPIAGFSIHYYGRSYNSGVVGWPIHEPEPFDPDQPPPEEDPSM